MASATVANNIASQIEYIRPELEALTLSASVLWKRIKTRTDIKAVSNRPARIPFEVLSGASFRVGSFDGGDMGTGSALQEQFGNLSCTSFLQCTQYSALSEWATDGNEKAVKDYVELINQRATETMAGYLDAAIQGDGSNTLDTVVGTASTNGIVVSNVNLFQDGQVVDVWSALGGTKRGSFTIQSARDNASNTLWGTAAFPAGTVAGDLLLISGSTGTANSGIFGLRYYQQSGNAGTYMGINRADYPGVFTTPYINANGALTPALVRALEAQVELKTGSFEDGKAPVVHGNVDVRAAWENNSITTQSVILNQVKGDQSVDMLKRKAPTSMAGLEYLTNIRARPGIMDVLALDNWFRIETKPLDYFEVGGQTVFQSYGTSGGLQSSMMFYLVLMTQLGNANPQKGAYMNNITIPSGYFGH